MLAVKETKIAYAKLWENISLQKTQQVTAMWKIKHKLCGNIHRVLRVV